MSGYSPKLPISGGINASVPPADRYRILGRIASGGMAEIYLARMKTATGAEREVVLKRLMPELQSDHEFVQMFYDEARIASQMSHPNIVQIYELGELDGSLFISMELLRGVNLRDLLARMHNRGKQLPMAYGVRVACGALEALSYAHRFTDQNGRLLNVVHRDVSPQNILVTYDGVVKLVDFGVAKAEGRLHQTRAGLIKGKFAYMSPEQVSGGKVDGRSDIFALAEVFYELLLKRHPFYASSDMDVLRAILDADPPHPNALDQNFPAELGAILMRALRKNPTDRYSTASAMHDALEGFLTQQRTPVTSNMLGKLVRELFQDRVDKEQRARESGDERLLIDAMAAGRAEPLQPQPKKRSHSRPNANPIEESDPKYVPALKSGRRDRVVEIARASSDPGGRLAEKAPAFIAHSGYTDPALKRRRFQSQVRRLFDDPAEPTPGQRPGIPASDTVPTGDLEFKADEPTDTGEIPTMLGSINTNDVEELRKAERKKRTPQIEVAPASQKTGPVVKRSPQQTQPPQQPARPITTDKPKPKSGPQSITPRSRTVLQTDEAASPSSDRWGLLLFVAGLGALVGAIVYAIILYTGTQTPLMRLEVRSAPPGASILFDGIDTAAQTPTVFQNIAANREHTLELRLDGYEPHLRKIAASPDIGELIVNWTFKPVE